MEIEREDKMSKTNNEKLIYQLIGYQLYAGNKKITTITTSFLGPFGTGK